MARKPNNVYQIKARLDLIRPPVWRRISVPGNATLLKLHDILQIAMGWQDYHLHLFRIGGAIYGDPEDDEYGDRGTLDEAGVTLGQVVRREGQAFGYEYDFGDGWTHTLLVEKILPFEGRTPRPRMWAAWENTKISWQPSASLIILNTKSI